MTNNTSNIKDSIFYGKIFPKYDKFDQETSINYGETLVDLSTTLALS